MFKKLNPKTESVNTMVKQKVPDLEKLSKKER